MGGHLQKIRTELYALIIPAGVLILWWLVTAKGAVQPYLLPSPVEIAKVAFDFIFGNLSLSPYSGTFVIHAWQSLMRVVRGFLTAAVIGVPLGLLTGRILIVKKIIDPSVNLIRAIPGIGWLPLAMVWFGVGEATTLFLIALAAFFPIYLNTAQGAKEISPLLLRAGEMLGADKFSLFATVILPASLPSIIAGLRLGLGISWAYLVLGELTGVTYGLGAVMMDARMLGHVDVIMVAMIMIAILGWICDKILLFLIRLFYMPKGA